jgi:hypothetical protein
VTFPARTALTMLVLLFLATGDARVATQEGGQPPLPPPRPIPGITAEDRFPGACVDCHVDYPEAKIDARFSTMMTRWRTAVEPKVLDKARAVAPAGMTLKGVHPAIPATMSVPSGCLACHGKTSKTAPPLGPLVHVLHLTGGKTSVFLTMFQGECTHCHKLDAASGQWRIPSGREK